MNIVYNAETGYANIPPPNHLSTEGREMTAKIISQKQLKEIIDYNPETGIFKNRVCRGRNAAAGKVIARSYISDGYAAIKIDGKEYRAHRLAILYVYGSFPEFDADHINGVRSDNRIINLRCVTRHENCKNKVMNKHNKTGVTGVSWAKWRRKWQASIGHSRTGRDYKCSYHDDFFEAVCSRKSAEIEFGYHKNHGRRM